MTVQHAQAYITDELSEVVSEGDDTFTRATYPLGTYAWRYLNWLTGPMGAKPPPRPHPKSVPPVQVDRVRARVEDELLRGAEAEWD